MDSMLIKLAVTVAVVLLLAEVSRRSGSTIAGILAGLPLGVGITIFFLAREQGTAFVVEAIPWGIAGLSATILFCLVYLLVGRALHDRSRLLQIAAAVTGAVASYLLFSFTIRWLRFGLIGSAALTAVTMAANLFILNRFEFTHGPSGRGTSSLPQLLLRGSTAGLFVILITGLARWLGAEWSGIFSAFPSMLFPLLIILHFEEGERLYPGVILGYGFSVGNLVLFYLFGYFLLPRTGPAIGFVLLYAISAVCLLVLNRVKNGWVRRSETVGP